MANNDDIPYDLLDGLPLAPIVVRQNHVKCHLNTKRIKNIVTHFRGKINYVKAVDSFDSTGLDKEMIKQINGKIGALPPCETGGLMKILPLATSCDYLLTKNIDYEIKLLNGVEIEIVYINLEEKLEDSSIDAFELPPNKKSGYRIGDGFQLKPVKIKFSVFIDELNKDIQVTRLQFPLVPSYSYLGFHVQGKPLDHVIADLPKSVDINHEYSYTVISRVERMNELHFLRSFDMKAIGVKM